MNTDQRPVQDWDEYARWWNAEEKRSSHKIPPSHRLEFLGGEWSGEGSRENATNYGLPPAITADFSGHVDVAFLSPHLPNESACIGMEIGPGGGRFTRLLLDRCALLHAVEPSAAMGEHMQRRFPGERRLVLHHNDGLTLPDLEPGSLDFCVSIDVFVHFEPRRVYHHLRQLARLLREGGIGIIHHANTLSEIGFRQFELDLDQNLVERTRFGAFGVMCPELMAAYVNSVGLKVVRIDTTTIPRDAVTVFEKPVFPGGQDQSRTCGPTC